MPKCSYYFEQFLFLLFLYIKVYLSKFAAFVNRCIYEFIINSFVSNKCVPPIRTDDSECGFIPYLASILLIVNGLSMALRFQGQAHQLNSHRLRCGLFSGRCHAAFCWNARIPGAAVAHLNTDHSALSIASSHFHRRRRRHLQF